MMNASKGESWSVHLISHPQLNADGDSFYCVFSERIVKSSKEVRLYSKIKLFLGLERWRLDMIVPMSNVSLIARVKK